MAEAARLNWLHVIMYGVVITLIIYVIVDLEYPRYGLHPSRSDARAAGWGPRSTAQQLCMTLEYRQRG